jgi:spore coat protein A
VIRPTRPRRVALMAGILIGASPGAVVAAPTGATTPTAFTRPLLIPKVLTGANITLKAKLADIQILPGAKTRVWTYNGTFPGPTIRRPTGQTTTVTLVNSLPAYAGELTLHNHGHQVAHPRVQSPSDSYRSNTSSRAKSRVTSSVDVPPLFP